MRANININDESENKINNISPHKVGYNNYEANFVIAPINKDTSEFICIYKKMSINFTLIHLEKLSIKEGLGNQVLWLLLERI